MRLCFYGLQTAKQELCVFVATCRVLNQVHRAQETGLTGCRHHPNEVNALDGLNGLETDHLVEMGPNIELQQKQEDHHQTDCADVLVGIEH